MDEMNNHPDGRVRLVFPSPTRGLIGYTSEFLTDTRGTGIMNHVFHDWGPHLPALPGRTNGTLISMMPGDATAFSLWNLEDRGKMFVAPGTKLYEGMIIGIHARENDLAVNPIKGKKLTNIRAAGRDDNINLTPPLPLSLDRAIEFIQDDELVEVTPTSIRLRKRLLTENERKRAGNKAKVS